MCNEWEEFNLWQTINVFENASNQLVLLPVFKCENFIFSSKYKPDFILEECLEPNDLAPRQHPNENGHKKIANRLIRYIDSVTLL